MSHTPLARALHAHLLAAGLKQEELIRRSGAPKSTVNRWFSGQAQQVYSPEHLLSIARVLHLPRLHTNELLAIVEQPSLEQIEAQGHPYELGWIAPWRVTTPVSLPASLTSFVGREQEHYEIGGLLLRKDVRLVTLTGPGGSGKTRLALHVAGALADAFPDGVVFVPFASVRDPELLLLAIAPALGLRDVPGRDPLERLIGWIGNRRLLLVIDNLEQLHAGAPVLTALLRGAPGLKLLVTSRVPLRLTGEHERVVPPFTPPVGRARLVEARENPAVQLFIERARAVDASFAIGPGNVASVIELCRRVDGLPLAIELAAARCRTHSLAQLLAGFPSPLDLGDDAPRDAEPRHQGLRAALGWSVDLLAPEERQLFAWLGAFHGAARLADIVAIADLDPAATTATVAALAGASLLVRTHAGTGTERVSMLETIRELAREDLLARCEDATARRRHAEHYLALAQPTNQYVPETRPDDWLERIDRERDNLHAALDWASDVDVELAARLAVTLWPWWHEHQHIFEGRRRLAPLLDQADGLPPDLQAGLRTGGAILEYSLGDYTTALSLAAAALDTWTALGDVAGQAICQQFIGWIAYVSGRVDEAFEHFTIACALWESIGEPRGVGRLSSDLALVKTSSGKFLEAEPFLERAWEAYSSAGDPLGMARSFNDRGLAAMLREEIPTAIELLTEATDRCRAAGASFMLPSAHLYLGSSYCFAGETGAAKHFLGLALSVHKETGDRFGGSIVLLGFAAVAWREEQPERAARLCGAVLAVHGSTGMVLAPMVQSLYERENAEVRARLSPEAYERAFAEGSLLSFAAAATYALEATDDHAVEPEPLGSG